MGKVKQAKKDTRYRVIIDSGFKCHYCRCDIFFPDDGSGYQQDNTATVDHVIPRNAGGSYHYTNLVACCFKCNTTRNKDLQAEHFKSLKPETNGN